MGKNILIISTSLRKGSNSEALAGAFAKGALDAGHQVREITLRGKNMQFCKGLSGLPDNQKLCNP